MTSTTASGAGGRTLLIIREAFKKLRASFEFQFTAIWSHGEAENICFCSIDKFREFPPKINRLFVVSLWKSYFRRIFKDVKSTAGVQLTFVCESVEFWSLQWLKKSKISKMNNAKLYNKSNALQKRDAQEIMNEFSDLFEAKSIGDDFTLLDIGCGAGDVLAEVILPKIPNKFAEVVGVDISKQMIKYASEKYRSKFLKFLKVDIESDFLPTKTFPSSTPAMGQLKPESFNFVTSFYCLHWIQDQR